MKMDIKYNSNAAENVFQISLPLRKMLHFIQFADGEKRAAEGEKCLRKWCC